jgi:hypothetical protein
MRSGGTSGTPRRSAAHFCFEVPILRLVHVNALDVPSLFDRSPNAEEALGLLSVPLPPTKPSIELACKTFLDFGVGPGGTGWVIIRSGSMGAYIASRSYPGSWIDAYWTTEERVVDVTGKFPMGLLRRGSEGLIALISDRTCPR